MDHTVSHADVEAIIDHYLATLPGWCTPEKGKRMATLCRGASLCVEIGVFGGRGLTAMALALRDQGFGRADGIDPYTPDASLEGANDPRNDDWWGHLDYAAIAQAAQVAVDGLAPYALLVRTLSRDAVRAYVDGTIDVIHLDGNHSEECSTEDVTLWVPKVRPGGTWIFDDTDWPTTKRAQQQLEGTGFALAEDHGSWRVYERTIAP